MGLIETLNTTNVNETFERKSSRILEALVDCN